jgi:hypothetical protein
MGLRVTIQKLKIVFFTHMAALVLLYLLSHVDMLYEWKELVLHYVAGRFLRCIRFFFWRDDAG